MKIPAPPISTPLVDRRGIVSDAWARWFRMLSDKANRESIPDGGTSGQILEKASDSDFSVRWSNP